MPSRSAPTPSISEDCTPPPLVSVLCLTSGNLPGQVTLWCPPYWGCIPAAPAAPHPWLPLPGSLASILRSAAYPGGMEVPGVLETCWGWAHEPLVAFRAGIGHDSRQKATELRKPHSSHMVWCSRTSRLWEAMRKGSRENRILRLLLHIPSTQDTMPAPRPASLTAVGSQNGHPGTSSGASQVYEIVLFPSLTLASSTRRAISEFSGISGSDSWHHPLTGEPRSQHHQL